MGFQALFSNTEGLSNTAIGVQALQNNINGSDNTATGVLALTSNTVGQNNTANGAVALQNNSAGSNTAVGFGALQSNATGNDNTATGAGALLSNVGAQNTANGSQALLSNTSGSENTAEGYQALFATTTGSNNTGIGRQALTSTTTGSDNTAVGRDALANNTTGSNNIAVGVVAGVDLITGDDNIYIGNSGSSEADTIRIGDSQTGSFIAGISGVPVTGTAIVVNVFGQLGVASSSQRFKEDITPMNQASEAVLALKPVTFRYKKKIDPAGTPQFGLLAEDVEKVNPDLVVHDKKGKPYSVRYDQVNAMLLNEFLKEHRKIEEQDRTIQEQGATIAQLKEQMQAVITHAKDQDLQIQRVPDQAQINSPAVQTIVRRQ
jgi:endosialidase-like protein